MKQFAEFEVWTIKNFARTVTIRDKGISELLADVDKIPDSVTVTQSGDFTFTEINFEDMLKNTNFDIDISEGISLSKGSAEYEEFINNAVATGTISKSEGIRQSGIWEDKGRLIADLKTRDAASATIEREQEAVKQLPQFRQLTGLAAASAVA